ncbi:MAG: GTPase Era [Alphaproteobacteria bacterium]|nr:GTPase Era [Alphaproteobacteria bacterium]|tara:strand:+ start:702 stop:1604 length:903 start_codon:yes stop_codon:yes gene_type:complete
MVEPSIRCGIVSVLGAPNAGKSTLVNRLVGAKVSIVSPKVQTTRTRVRGIAVKDETQVIYTDTPGVFAPKRRLDRAMVDAAWGGASDADVIAVLVDAKRGVDADVERIIEGLEMYQDNAVLVLNKVDGLKREVLLELAETLNERSGFDATFMISALNGSGVDDIEAYFLARMPTGPWLFPEDEISDLPQRLFAAEVTREKAFIQLHQELPYGLAVDTESWEDFDNGSVRIEQMITISRDSHKGIVLGKGGKMIKRIRADAQADLAEILDCPVHLFVRVRVREKWADDPGHFREWGLRFDA